MAIAIQAISTHPIVTRALEEIFADANDYQVLPSASNEEEATSYADFPRLFILDMCFLRADLRTLIDRLRSRFSGSKILALVPPSDTNYLNVTRLLDLGIDGFVEISETWRTELPQAIHNILNGQHWVPSKVLTWLVRDAQGVEQTPLLNGHSLTAREREVLRLLLRSLTNKEISKVLAISERTVKFHVSHILAKLGLENRQGLVSGTSALSQLGGLGGTVDFSDLPDDTLSSSNSRTRLRR